MTIHKSASKIGTIRFAKTGIVNELFVGSNSSTGKPILWQRVEGHRPTRLTGRNLEKVVDELEFVLNEGIAVWEGERNDPALDGLIAAVRG